MDRISTEEILVQAKRQLDNVGNLYMVCLGMAFIVLWLTSGFAMALAVIVAFILGAAISHTNDVKKVRNQLEREVADEKGKENGRETTH